MTLSFDIFEKNLMIYRGTYNSPNLQDVNRRDNVVATSTDLECFGLIGDDIC